MEEKLLIAVYVSEKGMRLDGDKSLSAKQMLIVLNGVAEDLREAVAVEAVNRAAVAAMASQPMVRPVGNGVVGLNGKPLV